MSAGISGLIQMLTSLFVEAGGQGVTRGGGGILLSGLRKIGWAKGGSGGGGGRLGGHSIGGHRMGSGVGRGGNLSNYNPKTAHRDQLQADMNRGRRSGSDMIKKKNGPNRPANLAGRSSFSGSETLSGNSTERWVRKGSSQGKGYAPKPRSFIKF